MPYHSLNLRAALEADATGEIPVVLITITHPELDAPQRLSTDPLVYGTRHMGETYTFLPMGVQTPDQAENTPLSGALVIENMHPGIIRALRSVTTRGRVDLAVVQASSPDLIEEQYSGLVVREASGDIGAVEIRLGRDEDDDEPHPAWRMTAGYCPALRR